MSELEQAEYDHTQCGKLHLTLYFTALIIAAAAWFTRDTLFVCIILSVTAVMMLLLTYSFHHLRVRDEGDCLAVRYGPLPLFRKRIPYARITDAEADRSTLLDGWGIHYVPGRGWTYNLWGFDCVKLTLGRRTIRVGTDDPEHLIEFLRIKTGRQTS